MVLETGNPSPNQSLTIKLPFWRQLRWRLIGYFVLLAVVPVGIVAGLVISQLRVQARDQVIDQLESVAELKSQSIDLWLEENLALLRAIEVADASDQRLVRVLAGENPDADTLRDDVNQLLSSIAIQSDSFDELFLYNLDGRVLASSDPNQINKIVLRQSYFADSLKSDSFQPPYYEVGLRELTGVQTHLLIAANGNPVGVLAGRLNLSVLGEIMLERTGLSASGDTFLISAESNFLLTPSRFEADGYLINQAYTSEGIERALAGENGSGLYKDYRTPPVTVLGVYRWLPKFQAGMIAEIDQAEALAAFHRAQNVALFATVFAGLLAALIGFAAALQVSRPLSTLTRTAAELAGGDLTRRARLQSRSEVGVLAGTFNNMADQLEGLIGSLETRVEARTRDLQVAANVSRQITTVLNIDELLQQVVMLTIQSFDLYACLVFRFDPENNVLVRASGANTLGQGQASQPDPPIPLDAEPSIIAHAARTREIVTVNDVATSPKYLTTPLLPDTRAELAIPMVLGDRLLGVFDVQSKETDHFGDDDLRVLTALAEQVTIAVRNAELFAENREAREEAETANQVKSQFLAAVSHELRTPLNSVINYTKFVIRGLMGPTTDKQRDVLSKVVRSAEHLLNLINDVLDISKIESGSLELFVEHDIDLSRELVPVVATAESLLRDKAVDFQVAIDDNLPLISGDRQRLLQIMLNLISNACKFTETGTINLKAYQQDGEIVLAVKDTGPGIAPEDFEVVFEVFKQTESGIQKGGGTGLGLPISKRLTEAHGGRLWLESVVGEGSTFYVAIPVGAEKTPILS